MMCAMRKSTGEQPPKAASLHEARPRPNRKRTAAPRPNGAFARAFVDALHDILEDERSCAA